MKVLLFANTDWYLYNFRLPLARALRIQGYEVTLLSPPGRYVALMQAEGFDWLAFPLARKGTNPFIELLTIFRLVRTFRQHQPDIVHLFTIKPVLYGSIAARLAGVPRVINAITGLGYAFSQGRSLLRSIVTTLYRLSLRQTKVIFQNPDDQNEFLQNRLIEKSQAVLIPGSGVDMEIFRPWPEPSGEPVVMLAGRLLRPKGVPEFVEAAQQLQECGVKARFVLVGEPYRDNPETVTVEELSTWQKNGWVECWGWSDDMATVLAGASIVCLPTSYKEGLPRILVEACASGRPVVTTDIPGCRLIVRDGENGLLIPPHDVSALVKALKNLIDDPALRSKMGARGREIVKSEFSLETVLAQTLRVYAEENDA